MDFNSVKSIIESLIFSSPLPLTIERIRLCFDNEVSSRTIREAIESLNNDYKASGRSFLISEVGGGFQMMARPEYSPWIKKIFRKSAPPKLSQAALETLAVIAYRQPITKAEIESIRGVNVDGVLRTLLERDLIRIAGRMDTVGRPLLYGTTREFLRYFGLNKLSDLPKPKEIDEIMGEVPTGGNGRGDGKPDGES